MYKLTVMIIMIMSCVIVIRDFLLLHMQFTSFIILNFVFFCIPLLYTYVYIRMYVKFNKSLIITSLSYTYVVY